MLIEILKRNFLFQNLAAWLVSKIPCVVSHNFQKYGALKKAFYLTALERLDGDYLEFGVFTGSSFVFSMKIHRQLRYLGDIKTRFFGFDSFTGFGKVSDEDKHPFYLDSIFTVNAEKVIRNIKKQGRRCETTIVKGYFEESLKEKVIADFGIQKSRIVFIDCDLKEPSRLVLEFVRPSLQQGMILVMDDFFSYRGSETKGVAGAFYEFCEKYPNLKWRKLLDYGYGGAAYILVES
ncbi:MAG: TylF/MycF/NovP-related O-methyltransferase [Candidatus Poribacteria bacterium]